MTMKKTQIENQQVEKMDISEDKNLEKEEAENNSNTKETRKQEEKIKAKYALKANIKNEIKQLVLLSLESTRSKDLSLCKDISSRCYSLKNKLSVGVLSWALTEYYPELLDKYLKSYKNSIQEENNEDDKLRQEMDKILKKEKKQKSLLLSVNLMKNKKNKKKENKKLELGLTESKEEEEKLIKEREERKKALKLQKLKKKQEKENKKKRLLLEYEEEKLSTKLPETKVFLHLLLLMFFITHAKNKSEKDTAVAVSEDLLSFLHSFNRRTLDSLSVKAYYYYSLAMEKAGRLNDCREPLLQYHCTSVRQHNEPAQGMLIVCILRSFLLVKKYTQADKFLLSVAIPENKENSTHARLLYYKGLIYAMQLKFSSAFTQLTQALRRAPQVSGLGFRQTVTKLLVLVQLLMGDVPERSLFVDGDTAASLLPYFKLTQAVRVGNVQSFQSTVAEHEDVWERDMVTSFISRLRNNVIKTGLRGLNYAYTRISLGDIKRKLNLPSVEDTEFIVAKCIHDGVIEAVIDYENKYMCSKSAKACYSGFTPQSTFNKRILFCLDIHNTAVQAMRYPQKHKKHEDKVKDEEDKKKEGEDDSLLSDSDSDSDSSSSDSENA